MIHEMTHGLHLVPRSWGLGAQRADRALRMAHAASMSARPRKPQCTALDDALFARLPAKGDVARSGDVEKCVQGKVVWIRRRLVLGREALHLSRPGTDIAAESIPLAEIAHVVHANDSQAKTRKGNSHASDDELGSERFATVFSMQTKESGLFGGKTFYLRCSTELECDSWVKQLRGDVKRASQQLEREEKLQKVADARHSLMKAYDSNGMQVFAAIVMLGGFCTRIAESAIMPNEPANDQLERTFWIIDLVFIALYGTDLLLNFAAHCFTPFFLEWWNVYDVLVVSLSIASLCVDTLPGFSILRCLRLLKIGCIFRTGTASPRCLVNALTLSFLPILSTVAMFLLISCIYAVLAVDLFRDYSQDLFGEFGSALYSLVQVYLGFSWTDSVVANMIRTDAPKAILAPFFTTYLLFGIAFLSLLVGIILDSFAISSHLATERRIQELTASNSHASSYAVCLDKLLELFCASDNSAQLTMRISALYDRMDVDDVGSISAQDVMHGFRGLALPKKGCIQFGPADMPLFTQQHALCDSGGALTLQQFGACMRGQIRLYFETRISRGLAAKNGHVASGDLVLQAVKMLILVHEEQSISDSTSQAPSRMAVSAMKSDTPDGTSKVRDDVATLTDISVETSHQVLKKEAAPQKGQSHAMNGSHNAHMQVSIDPTCWGDIGALEKLKEKLASQEEKLSNLAQSEDQLVKRFEDMNVQADDRRKEAQNRLQLLESKVALLNLSSGSSNEDHVGQDQGHRISTRMDVLEGRVERCVEALEGRFDRSIVALESRVVTQMKQLERIMERRFDTLITMLRPGLQEPMNSLAMSQRPLPASATSTYAGREFSSLYLHDSDRSHAFEDPLPPPRGLGGD